MYTRSMFLSWWLVAAVITVGLLTPNVASASHSWNLSAMRVPKHLNARRAFVAAYYHAQQLDPNARLKMVTSSEGFLMADAAGNESDYVVKEWLFVFQKSNGSDVEMRVGFDGVVKEKVTTGSPLTNTDLPIAWMSDVDALASLRAFGTSIGESVHPGYQSSGLFLLQWQTWSGKRVLCWLLPYAVKINRYAVDATTGNVLDAVSGRILWGAPRPSFTSDVRAAMTPVRLVLDDPALARDLQSVQGDRSHGADALRGFIYLVQGRLFEGETIFRRLSVASPTIAEHHALLAESYFYRMAYDDALRELDRATALSASPGLYALRGKILALCGLTDEAVKSFERTRPDNDGVNDDIAFARGNGTAMSFWNLTPTFRGVTYVWHLEF